MKSIFTSIFTQSAVDALSVMGAATIVPPGAPVMWLVLTSVVSGVGSAFFIKGSTQTSWVARTLVGTGAVGIAAFAMGSNSPQVLGSFLVLYAVTSSLLAFSALFIEESGVL